MDILSNFKIATPSSFSNSPYRLSGFLFRTAHYRIRITNLVAKRMTRVWIPCRGCSRAYRTKNAAAYGGIRMNDPGCPIAGNVVTYDETTRMVQALDPSGYYVLLAQPLISKLNTWPKLLTSTTLLQ